MENFSSLESLSLSNNAWSSLKICFVFMHIFLQWVWFLSFLSINQVPYGLSHTFSNTYGDNTVFIFHFVSVVYITLIDFCIPVNHGMWYFSHTVEYGLLKFCWKRLHLGSSGILAYNFITCCVLVWLLHQSNAGLVKWAWKCLLFQFFEEFEKDLYYFFFKC